MGDPADLLRRGLVGQSPPEILGVMHWTMPDFSGERPDVRRMYLKLMITACALESYWYEHGAYPEDLASLVPEMIGLAPNDLDGMPLRYRLNRIGMFCIESVVI